MSQNTFKKSLSFGINALIVIAVAIVFVLLMLFVILPQIQSANATLVETGDKIVDMFTPRK